MHPSRILGLYQKINLACPNNLNPILLAKWDDFRTTNWVELVDEPEILLNQTTQLLNT